MKAALFGKWCHSVLLLGTSLPKQQHVLYDSTLLSHCIRTSNCCTLKLLQQWIWGLCSYGIRHCVNWYSDLTTLWCSIILQKTRILNLKSQKTKQYNKQLIFFHQPSLWSTFLCHIIVSPKVCLRLISEWKFHPLHDVDVNDFFTCRSLFVHMIIQTNTYLERTKFNLFIVEMGTFI